MQFGVGEEKSLAQRSVLRTTGGVALALATALSLAVTVPAEAGPTPQPLTGTFSGTNAVNRIQDPGRRCADGGSGQYRHISVEQPVAPILSAALPGFFRATLDVHHDGDEPVGTPLTGSAATAFLQGTESHATLSNQRGSVPLRLSSGSCAAPSLSFDGIKISGAGSWTIDTPNATGAYRSATGSGTALLDKIGVEPGADNSWSIGLNGTIVVLQPSLQVDVVSTSWGNLGVDYVTRRVTVVYKVTNTGPGDAFGTVMTEASSPTAGVTPLGPVPQNLGDLLAGESINFAVRYQFTLLAGPCQLVILGCQFDTKVSVSMPDALDKADTPPPSRTNHVTAPTFPPPL
ncbi:MAG: hypothetical protein QOF21_3213 [Actinomycetota bacterium]|jgi:hypothetical protein